MIGDSRGIFQPISESPHYDVGTNGICKEEYEWFI